MAKNLGRRLGLAVLLMTIASPLSPESGLRQPSTSQGVRVPAPEPASSEVLLVDEGEPVTASQLERGFVVVRRKDGRVPRAWLWDEPLGCPRAFANP